MNVKNTPSLLRASRAAVLAAVVFGSSVARALPSVGTSLPSIAMVDGDDKRFDLRSTQGRPVVVVYEDKDAAHVNDAFKAELGRFLQREDDKRSVAVVPVADVRRYDYWPARGFVKSAIRDESKRQGTRIFCDWNGDFARALSLQSGTSSIIVFGRSGRVLTAKAGKLSAAEMEQVLALLRSEIRARPT